MRPDFPMGMSATNSTAAIHPAVELVIVDAVEDISQIGQRVETVQLGGFNDGHLTCEGY